MKKNNSKLILFLVGLLIAGTVLAIFGRTVKSGQKLDLEYGSGHEIVYIVDSQDAEVVKSTAAVLEKRAAGMGASGYETVINGNTITLHVTGVEDIESLRKAMLKKGLLTFRDSADKLLMDGAVLNADTAVQVLQNNNAVYYVLKVSDTETFYSVTSALASAQDKNMVIWLDFDGTTTYKAESEKTSNQLYLAAAPVSSGIKEDCYITTSHPYEEAVVTAAIINSGALPAAVTESSFNEYAAKTGVNGYNTLWTCLWGTLALVALAGILRYGLAGVVTAVVMAVYAVAYFTSVRLLHVPFSSKVVVLFAIMLAGGLALIIKPYERFRLNLLKGRNVNASLDQAYGETYVNVIESGVAGIVVGLVSLLLMRSDLTLTVCIMSGAVLNLVLFVFANQSLMKNLVGSRYADKVTLYAVKASDLPDVSAGDTYSPKAPKFALDFAKLLGNNVALLVMLALAVVAVFACGFNNISWALLAGAIAVVVIALYSYFRYRDFYPAVIAVALCTALLTCMLAGLLNKNLINAAGLAGLAVAATMVLLAVRDIKSGYRILNREKVNAEKLGNFANSCFNGILGYLLPVLCAGLVLSVAAFSSLGGFANTLLGFAVILLAVLSVVLAGGRVWYMFAEKNMTRKPKKSNKKKKKELKETTIFGINEVK